MSSTIIIDGNSIAHQHHNTSKLSIGNNFEVQAIFGVMRSIHKVALAYPGWKILTLWDGRAQFRYDLYPGYKGNRGAKTPEEEASKLSLIKQRPFIKKGLQLLGVNQVMCSSLEADDLGGYFSKALSAAGHNVVLTTGDSDWIQLVNQRVQWYDPIRDKRVTFQNLFEQTGYMTTEAFIQGKALLGDSTDTIDGVAKIGKKTAPEILAQFGTVENFFEQVDSGSFPLKYVKHKNLASPEGRAIFERNMKLMDLRNVAKPPREHMEVTTPAFSKNNFQYFCEKLAFRSILVRLDDFYNPFKEQTMFDTARRFIGFAVMMILHFAKKHVMLVALIAMFFILNWYWDAPFEFSKLIVSILLYMIVITYFEVMGLREAIERPKTETTIQTLQMKVDAAELAERFKQVALAEATRSGDIRNALKKESRNVKN